jgi:hypothetical protein
MNSEVNVLSEGFTTWLTTIGFLSSMSSFMCLKVNQMKGGFATLLMCIEFLYQEVLSCLFVRASSGTLPV